MILPFNYCRAFSFPCENWFVFVLFLREIIANVYGICEFDQTTAERQNREQVIEEYNRPHLKNSNHTTKNNCIKSHSTSTLTPINLSINARYNLN